MTHLLPVSALILYIAGAAAYAGWLKSDRQVLLLRGRWLLLFGLVAHGAFLVLALGLWDSQRSLDVMAVRPIALGFVSFAIIAVFLGLERVLGLSGLGLLVIVVSAVVMVIASVVFHFGGQVQEIAADPKLVIFHLAACLLATVLLSFTFVFSLGVIAKEFSLKRSRLPRMLQRLPSLDRLERFSTMTLTVGFWLMLVGVITGVLLALSTNVDAPFSDPRVWWSMLTLAVYAVLLLFRSTRGLRGAQAAWLAVLGFATVALSLLGVTLWGDTFHVY
ncbi:MAG: cytochrome c biogenesis protein CcsA [Bdellovibrionales bacterium]|nr:cytochrome c biogenesis protein CcsA [Bdellovibrionales bacterium]